MNKIVPKTINFNELVKNSNTTLSLNIQTKLIKLLTDQFTEEEQKWYVANLYIYMNYHPTNEYPINLEHVFKMIGFANKGNAMKTLKNNFTENEDYKKQVKDGKDLGGAGLNHETVMLNVDTFKNLCMLAKTEKGKEIRKYYVKLENIYNQIIKEEIEEQKIIHEELKKQIEEKDKLLQETQKEIKQIQDERIIDKKLEKHKVLLNLLNDKNCIYLIELSENLIKIGSSCDRIQAVYGGEGIFLDVFECNEFRNVERNILNDKVIQENKFKGKLDTGHTSNEVIRLSNTFTYNQLVEIVEKYILFCF